MLVDTHAHIHFDYYAADPDEVLAAAHKIGVEKVICVGCTLKDSQEGVAFAADRDNVWASVGIHPHEAEDFLGDSGSRQALELLLAKKSPKTIAIGECGLDYFHQNSPQDLQKEVLKYQLGLARQYNLPAIFHVREAFSDFWPIYDQFPGIAGVIHSFTGTRTDLSEILARGLYVGLNGIVTFTKDFEHIEAAKVVPLDRLVVETDAPYLTPAPFRGKVCKPEHVEITAKFLAELKGVDFEQLAQSTTNNASTLFGI